MTVIDRIGSWSYELKNIFCIFYEESFFLSEIVERKKVFEKTMFYVENGNAVYIP